LHIEMVHANKKPFKCNLCEHAAFYQTDLMKHIECVHDKLKPHLCNICQK
jgi:hypothetical protein